MKWVKTTDRVPQVGDYYYVQIDIKQDSVLKTICEWAKYPNGNYDWDFKGIQHFPGLKEEAEVISWMDEGKEGKNNYTLREEGMYIVIAYRYGHREGHSYLVDLCGGIDTASEKAEEEANYRGGKYSVVVFAKRSDSGDIEEIYEAKCPEHYTKGTHPFIAKKDHDDLLKAFGYWLRDTYGDINGVAIDVVLKDFLLEQKAKIGN